MRVAISVSSIIISLILLMVIGKNSLAGNGGPPPKCLSALFTTGSDDDENFEYECTAKGEDVNEDWTLEFELNADDDDLIADIDRPDDDDVEYNIPCECKTSGSFSNPKFEQSPNRFLCTGNSDLDDDDIISFGGKGVADEKRILEGQAFTTPIDDDDGDFWVVQCNLEEEEGN